MTDVTELVRQWIRCSNDLWLQWFASTECGVREFPNIEFALFKVIVLEKCCLSGMVSLENVFDRLRVSYSRPIDEQVRQFCVVQRSGNVFCRPHDLSIAAGASFRVKAIDTMGTMENGRPYVEVKFKNGYILEEPHLVEFFIE